MTRDINGINHVEAGARAERISAVRQPRVLFLNHTAILGGAELQLLALAKHFRESCSVVLLANGPLNDKLREAGVRVRVNPIRWALEGVYGGKPGLVSPRAALEILRSAVAVSRIARRCDFIYANSRKALIVAAIARRLAHRPVLWAHQDLIHSASFSPAVIRQMIVVARFGADRTIACSHASAFELIRRGVPEDSVFVVHHGIEANDFREAAAIDVRREFDFDSGPVAGLFGRVTRWKGQHIAIELLSRIPELQLLIAGGEEEPEYAESLRRRASELGVCGRVRFLGHRDDVAELMCGVDTILHTSIAPEPFGRVIVEGMLACRPVIATAAGGVPEIIEDRATGILVPPGDVEALEAAVLAVLKDPGRARAIATAGHARARTEFGLERMLDQFAMHFHQIAGRCESASI